MLASSEERETDSVYLVEFAREKTSQFRMNMWREDPNPKIVGNLIKGEQLSYNNVKELKEALKIYKAKKFKKYKLKIPFNPKSSKYSFEECKEIIQFVDLPGIDDTYWQAGIQLFYTKLQQ
jgi:hypothetical protein